MEGLIGIPYSLQWSCIGFFTGEGVGWEAWKAFLSAIFLTVQPADWALLTLAHEFPALELWVWNTNCLPKIIIKTKGVQFWVVFRSWGQPLISAATEKSSYWVFLSASAICQQMHKDLSCPSWSLSEIAVCFDLLLCVWHLRKVSLFNCLTSGCYFSLKVKSSVVLLF